MSASTLTVVLARPTSAEPMVRDALEGWTRAGLIEPLLWTVMDEGDSTVTTWLGGDRAEVDLRAAIAAEPYGLLRLIACHVLDSAEAPREDTAIEFARRAAHVQGAVARALAPQQRLVRLSLLIPASGAGEISLEALSLPAEANVLVAPEQRITPRHASVEVGDADLVTHAASAIASVSGRWRASEVGPFDAEDGQGSSTSPRVTVVRSFARALRIRGALGEVATDLLDQRRSEAWAAHAAGATPARDPQGVVGTLLREFVSSYGERLTYQPGPAPRRPQMATVRVGAAAHELFRYVARGLRDVPSDVASRVEGAAQQPLSDFAQRAAAGGPAALYPPGARAGYRWPVGDASDAGDATDATVELARDVLHQAGGDAPAPPPAGETWQALRQMSFGAIDGSAMPHGISEPTEGADRVVLASADNVAPDPKPGAFQFSSVPSSLEHEPFLQAPIRVCDAFQATRVRALLDDYQTAGLSPKPVGQQEETPDDATSPAAQEQFSEDVTRLRRQFDAWIADQQRSLLWRLASRLSDALTDGREDLLESVTRVRQGEPRVNESALEAAQTDLRRNWLVITVAALILGVLTFWVLGGDDGGLTAAGTAVTATAWLLAWAACMVLAFMLYQGRLSHLQYDYQRRHAEYLDAFERSLDAARQVDSLASMYRQLRCWAEVIGWMVHHPEGPVMHAPASADSPCNVDVPPSVVVTEGVASESSLRRIGAIVGRDLFQRGWILDLYARYRGEAIERMKYEQGLSDDDLDPDLDRDLAVPTPLGYLLHELRTGRSAQGWTQQVLGELARTMQELPPAEMVVAGGGDHAASINAAAFLAEIVPPASSSEPDHLFFPMWTPQARQREAERISNSVVWAPPGLDVEDHHAVQSLHGDPDAAFRDVFVLECARLDMANPASYDSIALFGRSALKDDAEFAHSTDGAL